MHRTWQLLSRQREIVGDQAMVVCSWVSLVFFPNNGSSGSIVATEGGFEVEWQHQAITFLPSLE